jgi:hypothetical protein
MSGAKRMRSRDACSGGIAATEAERHVAGASRKREAAAGGGKADIEGKRRGGCE